MGALGVQVPGWEGAPVVLIERGESLRLSQGMRINMCGDGGANHVIATFEELTAAGVALPMPIEGRRMNIRVRPGLSVFAKFIGDE